MLELLVGMALMALLAGLLFGALRLGAGTLARVDATAEALEDRRVVAAFIRQRLEQAEPLIEPTETGHAIAFAGGPDRLELVSEMPPGAGGGRHRVGFDNAGGALRLAWRPVAGDGASQRRRLEIGPARFAYYGRRAGDSEPSWHDNWTDELELPELVRLTLTGMAPLIVALPRDLASR